VILPRLSKKVKTNLIEMNKTGEDDLFDHLVRTMACWLTMAKKCMRVKRIQKLPHTRYSGVILGKRSLV